MRTFALGGRQTVINYVPTVKLRFSEHELHTANGVRRALVIAPSDHVRIDFERLQKLREQAGQPQRLGPIDGEILAQAQKRSEQVHLTIFRGSDDEGSASWDFSDELSDTQAVELAYLLLRGQMLVYRGLVRAGLCLHIHSEWAPVPLDAYRRAIRHRVDELKEELRGTTPGSKPIEEADLWILRNLIFFFALSFDAVVTGLLPEKLPLMERRMDRVQGMVLKLPPEAFELA